MEEKRIIPKGKQKLTDDELSRISGGEDGSKFICYKCGGIEFPDASDLAKHEDKVHKYHEEQYNLDYRFVDPVKVKRSY